MNEPTKILDPIIYDTNEFLDSQKKAYRPIERTEENEHLFVEEGKLSGTLEAVMTAQWAIEKADVPEGIMHIQDSLRGALEYLQRYLLARKIDVIEQIFVEHC